MVGAGAPRRCVVSILCEMRHWRHGKEDDAEGAGVSTGKPGRYAGGAARAAPGGEGVSGGGAADADQRSSELEGSGSGGDFGGVGAGAGVYALRGGDAERAGAAGSLVGDCAVAAAGAGVPGSAARGEGCAEG